MRTLCRIVLLWLTVFAMPCYAGTLLVVIPTHTALTEEFVSELSRQRTDDQVIVYSLTDAQQPAVDPELIITMGVASLQWRLAQADRTPTIATYVSQSGLKTADIGTLPSYIQVLLANPEPMRQLRLAKLLIPRLRTAAMVHSPGHAEHVDAWSTAAELAGVKLNVAAQGSDGDLARTLVSVLDRSDVLLGLDDPTIYNADNLKTILLTSYTRNRVLIGPSAPFIAAGSLSTTFSSPADMARSLDYLLDHPDAVSAVNYPRLFSVLSNQQVARSMGFPPPDDAELATELARMEGIE